MSRLRIKFIIFMRGYELKFRILLTIKNIILLTICSSLLCCDVVPMQACSLLLGRLWEFDTDAIHHGRSNKYTLMHNGKKITLLPLTPNEIVQCDRAIPETAR
jgi:hypothetical protein